MVYLAKLTITAIFISSDGWRLKTIKLIQRLEPEAVIPKKITDNKSKSPNI